jgi:polyisoprenoid-binding protein YceI
MKPSTRQFLLVAAAAVAAAALVACSKPVPPTASIATPTPATITSPAGRYELDPTHSSLSFSVNHLGLSNYVARFTGYQVTLDLDPANLPASSLVATINPASIRTDYSGDYRAAVKDSKFQSWDEDLAQSDKFFNASQHPKIEFRSTRVEQMAPGVLSIAGDLSLRGQTRPVTLSATLVGSTAVHPFTGKGGVIGFSASGSFKRSEFGMDYLLKPPLVGDTVTIQFEGEFGQTATGTASSAKATPTKS